MRQQPAPDRYPPPFISFETNSRDKNVPADGDCSDAKNSRQSVRQESRMNEHQRKTERLVPPIPTKKVFEACMSFFRESHSIKNVNREQMKAVFILFTIDE